MRRAVLASLLTGLALLGCDAPAPERAAQADETPVSAVVATLEGVEIERAELEAFVARARHPGYRPATEREAQRLLFALLRERALQLESARRGLDPASLLIALTRPGETRRIVLDRLLARADVEFTDGALEPLVASGSTAPLPPGHSGGPL